MPALNVKVRTSEKQFKFLNDLGLHVPKRYNMSYKLISFIEKGNSSIESSREERIALAVEFDEKWFGKKVFHKKSKELAVVESFTAKSRTVMEHHRSQFQEFGRTLEPCAFQILIRFIDVNLTYWTSPGSVNLIET